MPFNKKKNKFINNFKNFFNTAPQTLPDFPINLIKSPPLKIK